MLIENIIDFLDDATVTESQILGNIKYIKSYYPVDDALRNKGSLTLISPKYVIILATILEIITHQFNSHADYKKGIIPDALYLNEFIDKCVKLHLKKLFLEVWKAYKTNVTKNTMIKEHNVYDILKEILQRIIHAKVGNLVSCYRNENLRRVNDVSFRKTLSIKSNIKIDKK